MEQYIDYLYIIPAALIAIMCHELTHGLFSHLQGDPTPKEQGRLSLNPAKHLDLFGTLCLIFFYSYVILAPIGKFFFLKL